MSATGIPRVLPLEIRLLLTYAKMQKRAYAPYIAAVQSTLNEAFGPLGILAYGVVRGGITADDITRYVQYAEPVVDNRLQMLGVSFEFNAAPVAGGISVTWTASKGTNQHVGSHTIAGNVEDVSDDWVQSLNLAVDRFRRWGQTLDPNKVKAILETATAGYEAFMTEGQPSARQQMAVIKHRLRLSAVNPNLYIQQLQNSVTKYQVGYQLAESKYREVIKWVADALVAATKATVSIVRVL